MGFYRHPRYIGRWECLYRTGFETRSYCCCVGISVFCTVQYRCVTLGPGGGCPESGIDYSGMVLWISKSAGNPCWGDRYQWQNEHGIFVTSVIHQAWLPGGNVFYYCKSESP